MDISHTVLVEIGEGQRLQMFECLVAHVPVKPHFQFRSHQAGNIVASSGKQNCSNIEDYENGQRIKCFQGYKVIQCITLQQRNSNVNHRSRHGKQHHGKHLLFVLYEEGQHPVNAEVLQMSALPLFFLFHQPASSLRPDWIS